MIDEGLLDGIYRASSVDPAEVFAALSRGRKPITSVDEIAQLPVELLDPAAQRFLRGARREAAMSGAALGFGGWMGVPAGLVHLLVVVVRLAQRMALSYGFDCRDERGEIELWRAVAESVGARVDWDGLESNVMMRLPVAFTGSGVFANPLLLRAARAVIARLAVLSGSRVGRWIPLVGGGSGAILNYVEVDRIGRRLQAHWRSRHGLASFDPADAIEVEILG